MIQRYDKKIISVKCFVKKNDFFQINSSDHGNVCKLINFLWRNVN